MRREYKPALRPLLLYRARVMERGGSRCALTASWQAQTGGRKASFPHSLIPSVNYKAGVPKKVQISGLRFFNPASYISNGYTNHEDRSSTTVSVGIVVAGKKLQGISRKSFLIIMYLQWVVLKNRKFEFLCSHPRNRWSLPQKDFWPNFSKIGWYLDVAHCR